MAASDAVRSGWPRRSTASLRSRLAARSRSTPSALMAMRTSARLFSSAVSSCRPSLSSPRKPRLSNSKPLKSTSTRVARPVSVGSLLMITGTLNCSPRCALASVPTSPAMMAAPRSVPCTTRRWPLATRASMMSCAPTMPMSTNCEPLRCGLSTLRSRLTSTRLPSAAASGSVSLRSASHKAVWSLSLPPLATFKPSKWRMPAAVALLATLSSACWRYSTDCSRSALKRLDSSCGVGSAARVALAAVPFLRAAAAADFAGFFTMSASTSVSAPAALAGASAAALPYRSTDFHSVCSRPLSRAPAQVFSSASAASRLAVSSRPAKKKLKAPSPCFSLRAAPVITLRCKLVDSAALDLAALARRTSHPAPPLLAALRICPSGTRMSTSSFCCGLSRPRSRLMRCMCCASSKACGTKSGRTTQKRRSTPSPIRRRTCSFTGKAEPGATGSQPAAGSSTMPRRISARSLGCSRKGPRATAARFTALASSVRLSGTASDLSEVVSRAASRSDVAWYWRSSCVRMSPTSTTALRRSAQGSSSAPGVLAQASRNWHWNCSTWARNTSCGRIAMRHCQ